MPFLFEATTSDGLVCREGEFTWDDVPARVARLTLRAPDGTEALSILPAPGSRVFFVNEAVSVGGNQGLPSAKILGLVEGDHVHEYRLSLIEDAGPGEAVGMVPGVHGFDHFRQVKGQRRTYPLSEFPYTPRSLRSAA
jgi:hypothetical protein